MMASSCFCGPLLGLRRSRGSKAHTEPAADATQSSALLGAVLLGRRIAVPQHDAVTSQAELRARLVEFLVKQARVDPKIVDYMTAQLKIESCGNFADYFTEKDYEAGVQSKIVAKVAPFGQNMSSPRSELQTSRLRTAWTRARSMDPRPPTPNKDARQEGQPCKVRGSEEQAGTEAAPNRTGHAKPTTIGYGITSDPVRSCSSGSLFAAVVLSIKEPWRVIDVERSSCSVEDCQSYVQRRMKLSGTGEVIVERITINKKASEFTFCKCGADGLPGETARILAIHNTPLSLELHEHNTRTGLRVHWAAPYDVATRLFAGIATLAVWLENSSTETIGYGLSSEPIAGMSQDAVWKAMLHAMRHPAECGLAVDTVNVQGMDGYMQRTMRFPEKPGRPAVTDNIRVIERAREITYRPVVDGQEAEEEGVFALRSDPLRFEIFCRHSKNGVIFDWQAPRGPAISIFDAVLARASVGAARA